MSNLFENEMKVLNIENQELKEKYKTLALKVDQLYHALGFIKPSEDTKCDCCGDSLHKNIPQRVSLLEKIVMEEPPF